jgi:hypothetical protein
MSQVIDLDVRVSTIQNTELQTYSSNTITEVVDDLDYAINSTLSFDNPSLTSIFVSNANSVDSTATISNDHVLNFKIYPVALSSTAIFGWDDPLLNMEIVDVPTPEISSTVIIPNPNVLKVIGPLGIATTVNFGLPLFTDSIHRLLIFKDDNITKVGNTDAVVVAGGIRINPSIAKSETAQSGSATLPSNPVGFISVNIDGNDYKIPYYN